MPLFLRALYSALSKFVWSLALAYVTIACFYGFGGPINDFMSLPIWVPLGRLTYCTYLCHFIVLFYIACMSIDVIPFSSIIHTIIIFCVPCCAMSWLVAYWLSILFEMPFSKMELIIIKKVMGKNN
ncbi:unnamed protein product [Thelazia callipaeda]|uniref:Acyl_transf_3 domain-containing protein n=1 Tax=Thelazia callipaeda TaxID=103827 RepID=A0A0N5CTZ9_THECL|nr:unnamed protein product [Thelazia callipaeda]